MRRALLLSLLLSVASTIVREKGTASKNQGVKNKATMEPTKPMVSNEAASTKATGNEQQSTVNQKGGPYVPPELFPSKHSGGAR